MRSAAQDLLSVRHRHRTLLFLLAGRSQSPKPRFGSVCVVPSRSLQEKPAAKLAPSLLGRKLGVDVPLRVPSSVREGDEELILELGSQSLRTRASFGHSPVLA